MDDSTKLYGFWRKITANLLLVIFAFQFSFPVYAAFSLADADIELDLRATPQFSLISNSSFEYELASHIQATKPASFQSMEDFLNGLREKNISSLKSIEIMLPLAVGDITTIIPIYPIGNQIGDEFIQARYIRSQIVDQLNRLLIDGTKLTMDTEGEQSHVLYKNAIAYAEKSGKRFGERLTAADTPLADIIWPEYRTINGKKVLVPIVYLTDTTIAERKVDGHTVELVNGISEFNSYTLNAGTLKTYREHMVSVRDNFLNRSQVEAEGDLNITADIFENISGQVSAQGSIEIVANQITSKTTVYRFNTPHGESSRTGKIASISAGGDVKLTSYGDITIIGGEVNADGSITLDADGNILLTSAQTVNTFSGIRDGYDVEESDIKHITTKLNANDSITLIADGVIEINASELHADQGVIEILAGQGIYIRNADNTLESARSGKFGSNTIQERKFQSIAVRSALNAGQGIVIATEFGDINLKATELTSSTGTEIRANNGAVNFLMTKEQETYFYNKVHEGTWKIKTTTIEDNVETAVYNQIIGGVKVHATNGLTIELAQYNNGSTQENGQDTLSARISEDIQTLKAQINAAKASGQSTSSLDAQLASLSDDLLQEQLSRLAGADSSLAWMQDIHNDPEYQDNFNIVYQELIEIHKFDKTSTLSPAAMAIIAIAVSVALGPIGAGAIGAEGAIAGFALNPALQAGLLSITTQAATGLASGQGLEDTTKSLFHSDNIKATVTAMVTAGVLAQLKGDFEYFSATDELPLTNAQTITNQATQAIGESVVRSGINTLASGGDLGDFSHNFTDTLLQYGVDELGSYMATEIGLASKSGDIDQVLRYVSHAATGCIIGAVTAEVNDSQESSSNSCATGAGGAVIGELVADTYRSSLEQAEAIDELEQWMVNRGFVSESDFINLSETEQWALHQKTAATGITPDEMRKIRAIGIDISKMSAALTAFVVEADVQLAAATAENAVENNAIPYFLYLGYLALAANTTLFVVDVYDKIEGAIDLHEDLQAATSESEKLDIIKKFAIDAGISLTIDATAAYTGTKLLKELVELGRTTGKLSSQVTDELDKVIQSAETSTPYIPHIDIRKTATPDKKLEVGSVDTYGNAKKKTGDGTVDRDHQPSKAALLKRAENLAGRKLTTVEKNAITNNAFSINLPKGVHKSGRTYGPKNTPALINADANDLANAAVLDKGATMDNTAVFSPYNYNPINEGFTEMPIKSNTEWDTWLESFLDD
jgi:hypothetical protein